MSVEVNVAGVFKNKIDQIARFLNGEDWETDARVATRLASATNLGHLKSASVDYVFTDPPFGSNIFYADCALIGESWMGTLTDVREEAVVNRSLVASAGGKSVVDYRSLMTSSFNEIARILKPGGTATVVFQNTDPQVWQALVDALDTAGLACSGANTLDKTQQSHKGYRGRSGAEDVAGFDMILTIRHRRRIAKSRESRKRVADAVSVLGHHLAALPPVGASSVGDRQRTLPYLYAVLLEARFNGDIGLTQHGYTRVRELCHNSFTVDKSGRWSAPHREGAALSRRPG
ncbi:MAG: hypothetical protein M3077_05835 [Candidatus Dormibacteraeota bacterium]|nr:hypothetical protein [Candidatus Dormibacteraeota bacterium]